MNKQEEAEIASKLVERIIAGDALAEREMVERYHQGVIFMLRHRSNSQVLAEDLSQETWRIIIEKIRAGDLNDHSKLSAYIVQTAKNQLLMYYRSSQYRKVTNELDIDQSVDPQQQPQKMAEQKMLARAVNALLRELKSARDRELILRFYLREEDKQLICKDLNLDELHFNRVLFRARQRFKQLWQECMGDDE